MTHAVPVGSFLLSTSSARIEAIAKQKVRTLAAKSSSRDALFVQARSAKEAEAWEPGLEKLDSI